MFKDDLSRLCTGRGPEDTAVDRRMAVDLPRQAEPKLGLENRRRRAGWNTAHLATLIRQTA